MANEISGWDLLCGERDLLAIRMDVRHPFQADANGVALDLDGLVVFAFEDPSDGYRSCAASPMIAHGSLYEYGCDPEYIRAPVTIRRWTKDDEGREADGVEFIDRRNGETILRIGTDNADDYYPSFVCEWTPAKLASNQPSA